MNTIKYMYNKTSALLGVLCLLCALCVTSCEDMLDKGNDHVIYVDEHQLSSPSDTVTSVIGILNKLQAIAVRTNLLGEVRADLVTVRDNATTDLKNLAALDIDDDNRYNVPRDYYAVINNCNYFLAHADSLAGNASRNKLYFEAEIAQVHSIRAWTYLQLVLAYGRVPFVTEPVLTKRQSDEQYPMYDLEQICDYFVQDLRPYYAKAYPDYGTIGGDIDPHTCFFPTQVVTGDLYLWLAAKRQDPLAAREAAKAYYDYIVWNLSGKQPLTTTTQRIAWSENWLSGTSRGFSLSSSLSYGTTDTWGATWNPAVTAIPMDSASADGYFNELRGFYNTREENGEYTEACITPSQVLRDLSEAQDYVGLDSYNDTVKVTADMFSGNTEMLNLGALGDLRFYSNYSGIIARNSSSEEVFYQTISKHTGQHIGIYRASQIYLRLAEALNYAGYPRFSRQILTMGVNNLVIQNEVLPYYTTAADSAFIQYFDFNDNRFIPLAQNYTSISDAYGITQRVIPVRGFAAICNTWGIHGRGSGLPFVNVDYAPLTIPTDSTHFPYAEREQVGRRPQTADVDDEGNRKYPYPTAPRVVNKPSTWDQYPNETVDRDTYIALNPRATTTIYNRYVSNDSVGKYSVYVTETLPAYEAEVARVDAIFYADVQAYESRLSVYRTAHQLWHNEIYGNPAFIQQEQEMMDQLILDEQALELSYEGNRFYDLMRRAYWRNDNSVMVDAVSKRDATAGSKLSDRKNWFLRWKDKIGF